MVPPWAPFFAALVADRARRFGESAVSATGEPMVPPWPPSFATRVTNRARRSGESAVSPPRAAGLPLHEWRPDRTGTA